MTKAIIVITRETNITKISTTEQILIYLHGDAYPDKKELNNVFVPIWRYTQFFNKKRGYFDEEYLLARLTQHLANLRDLQSPEVPPITGIGILLSKPEKVDVDYIYIINPKEIKCYNTSTTKIETSIDM